MSSNEGLNAPRNLGGVLARIVETPDGGARIEVWTGDNHKAAMDTIAGELVG
jgi:hypothetical protein